MPASAVIRAPDTVRIDEQRCSLWVSGLSVDLYDPLDTKGCRRKINELGLNGRDCYNCLFPAFLYNWATSQEDYIAFYKDSCE